MFDDDDKDDDWWKRSPGDDGGDDDGIIVYHESVRLPMFNVNYEVLVANFMDEAMIHMRKMLGMGIDIIDRDKHGSLDMPGYACTIKGTMIPTQFYVFIPLDTIGNGANKGWPKLSSRIVHQATHLSWYILDHLSIDIDSDNHQIQCHVMEHLVEGITEVVDRGKEKLSSDTGL
jgi:hypothetical protein